MRVGRQVAARVVAHEQRRALGGDAVEPAHLGAEVVAREHPQAGQGLADVVGVALVEVGFRDARLRERGDEPARRASRARRLTGRRSAPPADRRRWATRRSAVCFVLCVLSAAIPLPWRPRGTGAYARAPIWGQVSGGPAGRASLCGSPCGQVAQQLADARLAQLAADRLDRFRDHLVAVARGHQVGAHHGVVLVGRLDEHDFLPAARSSFASLPSTRPEARRKKCATRCAGFHALRRVERRGRVQADDEVGRLVAQDVEVRGRPDAAVDVAPAADRDRAVEAGDRAGGGDGVADLGGRGVRRARTATRRAGGVVGRDDPEARVVGPDARDGAADRVLDRLGSRPGPRGAARR